MIMFESSCQICDKTGIASFEITWDLGHGKRVDRGSFIDRRDADKYIHSSKRSYILLLFSKYIAHARILFENGHHDFYRTTSKLDALDRCSKYNEWLADKQLDAICKVILGLEEDLRKILPSPNNNSYSSSESRILDMIIFAKRELAHLQPKTTVKQ